MLETSNLLTYTPEQLSLMVECIDDKIKSIHDLINEKEITIFKADDMSEGLERFQRLEISYLWTKMENLYGIRAAIVTNHQYVLKAVK